MSEVSRECIRDTLLAKRQCREQLTGFVRQVYNLGVRNLRDGQLAPHREPWHENRILDMQTERRHPPKIIIFVRNVYCVTVPSGMILVRQEGHITVTGNCDALSLYEAGARNVVSVPSGCTNLEWIDHCWD